MAARRRAATAAEVAAAAAEEGSSSGGGSNRRGGGSGSGGSGGGGGERGQEQRSQQANKVADLKQSISVVFPAPLEPISAVSTPGRKLPLMPLSRSRRPACGSLASSSAPMDS